MGSDPRLWSVMSEVIQSQTDAVDYHDISRGSPCVSGKCHFFTGRGLLKIGRIRYFFLDQKGGSKHFFKFKRGSLIFLERNKIFC